MSDWIKLDPRTAAESFEPQRRSLDGIQIELAVSPYDVPDAVRGYINKDENNFVIEFRYLDDEAWKVTQLDSSIALRLGTHTERLYGLEIDLARLRNEPQVNIAFTIQDSLKKAPRTLRLRKPPADKSFKAASHAIDAHKQLLDEVVHA